MEWLDSHQSEDAETYEAKQKEVEEVSNEVMKNFMLRQEPQARWNARRNA